MDRDLAIEKILQFLKQCGGATNSSLTELLEGDEELFKKVREYLIVSDLAKDKNNAGLVYTETG